MGAAEEDLIFTALCDRYRATTNVDRTISREELRQATGLTEQVLDATLTALIGSDGRSSVHIALEGDRILLGPMWRERCRNLPKDPGPGRP
jgi:hypothetical protein